MSTFERRAVPWGFVAACAACALVLPLLVWLALNDEARIPLAAAVLFPLLALAAVNIRVAIAAVLVYLILLGDLRRLLIPLAGWSSLDPLLLLGSAFAGVLTLYALASRALPLDTPMAKWTAALMGVMALQMLNPAQGGLVVGIAGALFLLVPLLWYWIGRAYLTPDLLQKLLFRVVVPLAAVALVIGLIQGAFGYFPYQMTWYYTAGYVSLGTPETGLAPISFFSSGTEHGCYLIIAAIALWAAALKGHRAALLLAVPLLIGVLLTGSRGPVVKLIGMAVVLWALLGESRATWLPRGLLALAVLGGGMAWSLSRVDTLGLEGPLQNQLDRQASLLEEREGGTVDVHSTLILQGYRSALARPLGHGLGAATPAAGKFGAAQRPTESDFGDVMVATGLVGGVIYHVMMGLIVLTAVRYWRRTRSLLALALVGAIGVNFTLWLGGGLYAVSALTWLMIGGLDRFNRDAEREAERNAERDAGAAP